MNTLKIVIMMFIAVGQVKSMTSADTAKVRTEAIPTQIIWMEWIS